MSNKSPVVATFEVEVSVSLSHQQRQEGRKALNLHWVGKENCNVYNDRGEIVDDPSIPWTPELKTSLEDAQHWGLDAGSRIRLLMDLHANGDRTFRILG